LNLQKEPTQICKVCFNEIKMESLHFLMNNSCICKKCLAKYEPEFKEFKFYGYKALAIYEYKDAIKEKLFIFKGCSDYELKDTFIMIFKKELGIRYQNYIMVPMPSLLEGDKERGFNHVIEMFKCLNLKMEIMFKKIGHNKQAKSSYFKRKEMAKHIVFLENIDLKNKKILLIDDVITTGSTLKTAIDLLKERNVNDIQILVMSKNEFKGVVKDSSIKIIK